MTHNPQLLEDLRIILQSVSEITLDDDMTGPVAVRNGQAIQAMTRKCPANMFNRDRLAEIFANDFGGTHIALYQVVEQQMATDTVFSTDPNFGMYYLIRFAVY